MDGMWIVSKRSSVINIIDYRPNPLELIPSLQIVLKMAKSMLLRRNIIIISRTKWRIMAGILSIKLGDYGTIRMVKLCIHLTTSYLLHI